MSFDPPDDRGYETTTKTKKDYDTNYDVTTDDGLLKRLLYSMYRNGYAPPSFSNALLNNIPKGRPYFSASKLFFSYDNCFMLSLL